MAIRTEPRIAQRLQPAAVQALQLLALDNAALTARLAIDAAGNPALELPPPVIPTGGSWRALPLSDPDGISAPQEGLIAHVLAEIGLIRLTPREKAIALALAGALEPTGWLGEDLTRLARDYGLAQEELAALLSRLQKIEPAGLFARNLAECLRLQAEANGDLDRDNRGALKAVLADLPALARGDLAAIAARSGLDETALSEAARQLRHYDPKPGLRFGPTLPPVPPDLILHLQDGRWQAKLHPAAPGAKLAAKGGDRIAARRLLAALQRRNETVLTLAGLIAEGQSAWLSGEASLLAPLSSAELTEMSGLHRATVNRILGALSAATPHGTRRLRLLAARPVRAGGPSAEAVMARLAELLRGPAQSDAALAAILAQEGLPIARRTVAKYRSRLQSGG